MNFFRIPPVPPTIIHCHCGGDTQHLMAFRAFERALASHQRRHHHNDRGHHVRIIARAFRRHRESFDIRKPTENLVTDGIYATSRNPAYLAMIIAIFGIGCATNSLAIMLATIPSFIVFNWYTIPWEESRLRRTLGFKYDEYAKRVRRWL